MARDRSRWVGENSSEPRQQPVNASEITVITRPLPRGTRPHSLHAIPVDANGALNHTNPKTATSEESFKTEDYDLTKRREPPPAPPNPAGMQTLFPAANSHEKANHPTLKKQTPFASLVSISCRLRPQRQVLTHPCLPALACLRNDATLLPCTLLHART